MKSKQDKTNSNTSIEIEFSKQKDEDKKAKEKEREVNIAKFDNINTFVATIFWLFILFNKITLSFIKVYLPDNFKPYANISNFFLALVVLLIAYIFLNASKVGIHSLLHISGLFVFPIWLIGKIFNKIPHFIKRTFCFFNDYRVNIGFLVLFSLFSYSFPLILEKYPVDINPDFLLFLIIPLEVIILIILVNFFYWSMEPLSFIKFLLDKCLYDFFCLLSRRLEEISLKKADTNSFITSVLKQHKMVTDKVLSNIECWPFEKITMSLFTLNFVYKYIYVSVFFASLIWIIRNTIKNELLPINSFFDSIFYSITFPFGQISPLYSSIYSKIVILIHVIFLTILITLVVVSFQLTNSSSLKKVINMIRKRCINCNEIIDFLRKKYNIDKEAIISNNEFYLDVDTIFWKSFFSSLFKQNRNDNSEYCVLKYRSNIEDCYYNYNSKKWQNMIIKNKQTCKNNEELDVMMANNSSQLNSIKVKNVFFIPSEYKITDVSLLMFGNSSAVIKINKNTIRRLELSLDKETELNDILTSNFIENQNQIEFYLDRKNITPNHKNSKREYLLAYLLKLKISPVNV